MSSNDFYVYALMDCDLQTPFYIGKGRRQRIGQHRTEALRGESGVKNERIREVVATIGHLPAVVVASDLTEAQAFDLEAKTILEIGRADLGLGPLLNLTDGGEGATGYKQTPEERRKKSIAHSTPEMVALKRAHYRRLSSQPGWQERLSNIARRVREDPFVATRLLSTMREVFAKPEVQERRRRSVCETLRRPEVRARLSESARRACERPEVRFAKVAAARARWDSVTMTKVLVMSATLAA